MVDVVSSDEWDRRLEVERMESRIAELHDALRLAEGFIAGAVPQLAQDRNEAVAVVLPHIRAVLAIPEPFDAPIEKATVGVYEHGRRAGRIASGVLERCTACGGGGELTRWGTGERVPCPACAAGVNTPEGEQR